MKKYFTPFQDTDGVYERGTNSIIIKRSQLQNLTSFYGTLLHESCHATSKAEDVTRGFELELTRKIGLIAAKSLKKSLSKNF